MPNYLLSNSVAQRVSAMLGICRGRQALMWIGSVENRNFENYNFFMAVLKPFRGRHVHG